MKKIYIIFVTLILSIISISIAIAQPGSIKNLGNITYESDHINWTWQDPTDSNFSHVIIYLNGILKEDVLKEIEYYNATNLLPNTNYRISTHTVDTNGSINNTWRNHTARTARLEVDTTPPASIRNLRNITYARTHINWTWQDPNDDDFDRVMVYINGTFKTNVTKGIEYYNAIDLNPNTSYKIGTHTVDISGNINMTWKNSTKSTAPPDVVSPASVTSLHELSLGDTYINWTWRDPDDSDFDKVMVYINGTFKTNVTKGIEYYNAIDLNPNTNYEIGTHTVDIYGNINGTWVNDTAITSSPRPRIDHTEPEQQTVHTLKRDPVNFTVSFDQVVNVTWLLNNNSVKTNDLVTSSYYLSSTSSVGTQNITVIGNNTNGSVSYSWTLIVHSDSYNTGNRIWDANKDMSTTYIWNSYSFSGFYYDIDENLNTEELIIRDIDRSIGRGDMTYETSPVEVGFEYSGFGKYQVIGFMADKYFAGYTDNSIISNNEDISSIANGQLHKVLIDDDERRTVSVGSTLSLKDGYVLKIKEVDVGAGRGQIWVVLLKDGSEIDNDVLEAGDNYIYEKRIGSVDLPVIAIHFDTVFRGREVSAAFTEGIFQISDSYDTVKTGNRYGKMEVSSVSRSEIIMENRETVDLSPGNKIDLMGNFKIIVADDDRTLRFALSVDRQGKFEARGTIYNVTSEWTPLNFGLNVGDTNIGFYYNLDEGIGTETLRIDNVSGRTIRGGKLIYSTLPAGVDFEHSGFGRYQVIGFMAEKYFAGYTDDSTISNHREIDTMGSGQLHRVLIDDDNKRTISEGGSLALGEGYVLKMTDVDVGAGKGQIWIKLLKDGDEVDDGVVEAGDTYIYEKRVGSTDLPIIAVRFDAVFRGKEMNAAFIKGTFQISSSYTEVKSGNKYGKMEVSSVSGDSIVMENEYSIGLSAGDIIDIMGDIKFRVADKSEELIFYPYVMVDMTINQLIIGIPDKVYAGDNISINVTSNSVGIEDVFVSIEPDIGSIGKTNKDGTLAYVVPNARGKYTVTAQKSGYKDATKAIEIIVENWLSINVPSVANQFDVITIYITAGRNATSGVMISFDNKSIGSTDNNGKLNYTLNDAGIHTISASKTEYISVSRDIEVRTPFSEFKALDISTIPDQAFAGDDVKIISNITNIGTKSDTLPIAIKINNVEVYNIPVDLASKETKEINFVYRIPEKGNYTIEILDQKKVFEAKDKERPFDIFIIVGIMTIIAAAIIYVLTKRRQQS